MQLKTALEMKDLEGLMWHLENKSYRVMLADFNLPILSEESLGSGLVLMSKQLNMENRSICRDVRILLTKME